MQVIGKATVPIIKFVEQPSGLSFDISFDAANGPQSAAIVRDLVARLPPMKPLLLVLKIFLQQREMNEVCVPRTTHNPWMLHALARTLSWNGCHTITGRTAILKPSHSVNGNA